MNPAPIALEVLLDKINLLYKQAAHSPEGLKGLELDLLKKYTCEWYDALLELDRGSGKSAPSTVSVAAPGRASGLPLPAQPLDSGSAPGAAGQESFLYPSRPSASETLRKEDAPEIRAGWGYAPHPPRAEPDTPVAAGAPVVYPAAAPPAPAPVPAAATPPPATPAPPAAAPPAPASPPAAATPPATPEPPAAAPAAATRVAQPPMAIPEANTPTRQPQKPVAPAPIPTATDEPALNDRFARPERELGQTLIARPAEDLRKLIDVNERFLFTRELFGGNSETYGQAIRRLNELPNLTEALNYLDSELTPAHAWNPESKIVLHLRDILEQRYR